MDFKNTKNITDNLVKGVITSAILYLSWSAQNGLSDIRKMGNNIADIKTQMIVLSVRYDDLKMDVQENKEENGKRFEAIEKKIDELKRYLK